MKRRPRKDESVVVDVPPPSAIPVTVKDQMIPMVVPKVKTMLEDLKQIVAWDLRQLRDGRSIGDSTGQRARNHAATIGSIMDSEKKEAEGPSGLEGATRAELRAALQAEIDKLDREEGHESD